MSDYALSNARKDKNYKRYEAAIDRALALFDSALQDWADYIAFLVRLLKALQTRPATVTDVPRGVTIAKRLAQCLGSNQESSVHLRALDIYVHIFSFLTKDDLGRDLRIWLPGLASTLLYASIDAKPILLTLFEDHVINLDAGYLRPASKSIILALLPGLEETESEEYVRTIKILNQFKNNLSSSEAFASKGVDVSGDQFFWQSLFLASISSPSRRQGLLAYLADSLPICDVLSLDEVQSATSGDHLRRRLAAIEQVTTPEPGLLVRCFASGLRDDNLLIQRGFLDILVTHLPLNSAVLQKRVSKDDLRRLVSAASSVVLRRDMSLNRRLWSWLLGPGLSVDPDMSSPISPTATPTSATSEAKFTYHTDYFRDNGLGPLLSSIQDMLDNKITLPSEKARPFRICLSLMDRSEIGALVLPAIFKTLIESLQKYENVVSSRSDFEEVLRSANAFFDGVESHTIWAQINSVLDFGSNPSTTRNDMLGSVDFVLFIARTFNVQEEEMLSVHIPLTMLRVLIESRQSLVRTLSSREKTDVPVIEKALQLLLQLTALLPTKTLGNEVDKTLVEVMHMDGNTEDESLARLQKIKDIYSGNCNYNDTKRPLFPPGSMESLMIKNVLYMIQLAISEDPLQDFVGVLLLLLDKLARRSSLHSAICPSELSGVLIESSARIAKCPEERPLVMRDVQNILTLLELIEVRHLDGLPFHGPQLEQIMLGLMQKIWVGSSPRNAHCNVEAADSLWRIHSIARNSGLVKSSLAHLMLDNANAEDQPTLDVEAARRFTVLWTHSIGTVKGSTSIQNRPTVQGRHQPNLSPGVEELKLLSQPLLLVLDTLRAPKSQLAIFTAGWLSSLTNPEIVLDHVIQSFLYTVMDKQSLTGDADQTITPRGDFDLAACLYNIETISNVISSSDAKVWSPNARYPPLAEIRSRRGKQALAGDSEEKGNQGDVPRTDALFFLVSACIYLLQQHSPSLEEAGQLLLKVRQAAIALLQLLLKSSATEDVLDLDLETPLTRLLLNAIKNNHISMQLSLIDLIRSLLLQRATRGDDSFNKTHRKLGSNSKHIDKSSTSLSLSRPGEIDKSFSSPAPIPPPLSECFLLAISTSGAYAILEHWIQFLDDCMPLYGLDAFQVLLALVDAFIKSISSVFGQVRNTFDRHTSLLNAAEPVMTLLSLLSGLDRVLASAHGRLLHQEPGAVLTKPLEPSQGFFGSMVSGVITTDPSTQRYTSTNHRLAVLLCFKDAIEICYTIWSWCDRSAILLNPSLVSSASLSYTAVRLKNRTRRLLEHLSAAEALECIEKLISLHVGMSEAYQSQGHTVLTLLHVLDGSRPRNTVPAIFNSIYSRTNPAALDPNRKSSMTSDLNEKQLSRFLVEYLRSLEDDAMDEIWADCITFLRDVLANPMPQRQVLPILLDFTAVLGTKISRTNFGEQKKMRRDLGDLIIKMLTATLTIKPLSFTPDVPQARGIDQPRPTSDEIVVILSGLLTGISGVFVDVDRINTVTTIVSTKVVLPTIRSKTFPSNIDQPFVDLLSALSRIPEASNTWRRDVAEAFQDPKFVHVQTKHLWVKGWLPVLRSWVSTENDKVSEIMTRIPTPTSAGIMFGVGAAAARSETDRKTQLSLRRTTLLFLVANQDMFMSTIGIVQEKVVELLTATVTSSPSSATRADVYILLRAILMKVSSTHLSGLWPVLSSELQEMFSAIASEASTEMLNPRNLLHACKLLETLLVVAADDFQPQEWLYITDTIDAVYRPQKWSPSALVDQAAISTIGKLDMKGNAEEDLLNNPVLGKRQPLLPAANMRGIKQDTLSSKVFRPFFQQLSMICFEAVYRMEPVDHDAYMEDILLDVFDDTTLV